MLKNSIILPSFFQQSVENKKVLLNSLAIVKKHNVNTIEFYYEGKNKEAVKKNIKTMNFESVYLGAMAAKINGLNLSSINEKLRRKSIEVIKQCVRDAYYYGSGVLLINSGPRPKDESKINLAYDRFKESVEELLRFSIEEAEDYLLDISLEPGDINIDSFELIGNTELAIQLSRRIREKFSNFSLTFDTSHLRQLGEVPLKSIKMGYKYCDHIHLANCQLVDPDSYLYGDKHPDFDIEKGEIDEKEIYRIFKKLIKMYENDDLLLGLEIISRENDKKSFFKKIVEKYHWFFQK